MPWHCGGEAFFWELSTPGAGDPNDSHGAYSAEDMDGAGSAGIKKACTKREVDSKLGQPTAIPDPVSGERKDHGSNDGGACATGSEPPAIGA
jgi:hypothetical protein